MEKKKKIVERLIHRRELGGWAFSGEKKVKLLFENRFSEKERVRPSLDGVVFNQISHKEDQRLVAPFEEIEIKEAIWDIGGKKDQDPMV